jgi:hypothetical protein
MEGGRQPSRTGAAAVNPSGRWTTSHVRPWAPVSKPALLKGPSTRALTTRGNRTITEGKNRDRSRQWALLSQDQSWAMNSSGDI